MLSEMHKLVKPVKERHPKAYKIAAFVQEMAWCIARALEAYARDSKEKYFADLEVPYHWIKGTLYLKDMEDDNVSVSVDGGQLGKILNSSVVLLESSLKLSFDEKSKFRPGGSISTPLLLIRTDTIAKELDTNSHKDLLFMVSPFNQEKNLIFYFRSKGLG